MQGIYLDNNATTQPDPQVVEAMMPYLTQWWGNPSSVHRFGQQARKAVDEARAQVAKLIGAADSELMFVGGGTEAVNTTIRGLLASRSPRKKIITSTVEHSATKELCNHLEREGIAEVVRIPVDHSGNLDLHKLDHALHKDPALATFMWANNETGVIFPIPQIAQMCKNQRVPLHTDGTQAVGKIPVDVHQAGVDAMSFAAHKFHGPKGVGGLFLRRGLRIKPLLIGGPQERSRRGGTENVPGVVGMGKAAELALQNLPGMDAIKAKRDRFERTILETIDDTSVNGGAASRVPNTSNISFAQLEAEAILILLSERGVFASAGAACSSGSLEPSPVLKAMGIELKVAHGAVRFSLSRFTTDAEIDQALKVVPEVIARLRNVLPVA
jgi:cysteine desulfurase